jgi:phosphatidylglycerophosphate synthase
MPGTSGLRSPEPPLSGRLVWVPNALSLMRLLLGLAFPLLPLSWRLAVALVAASSDVADGAASRWLRARTALGRVLDPVADKVFIGAVLLTLVADDTLWLGDAMMLAARDVVIVLGGAVLWLRHGRAVVRLVEPTLWGKAATVGQAVFLLTVLACGRSLLPFFAVAAALSTVAALDYLRLFLKQVRSAPNVGHGGRTDSDGGGP